MSKQLTLREAAAALGISLKALRHRIKTREIPLQKVPGPYGERYVLEATELDHLKAFEHTSSTGQVPIPRDPRDAPEPPGSLGSPEEPYRGSPASPSVPLETLQQALHLVELAQQERKEAQDEARRWERQVIALRGELKSYQNALTERAESLAEREARARTAEEQAAELAEQLRMMQKTPNWLERRTPKWLRRVLGAS